MEELIRSLIKFDDARNDDVVKWLQYIEEVFDQVQLQASHKYVGVLYFLTSDAAVWFKHNKSNIPDWFTFKRELIEAFSSSSSSRLLDRHQLLVKEELRTLGQEQDILRVPASSSTMPHSAFDNENISFDSINDNRINSFEDLESKHLCEPEQEHCSHVLIHLIDPDLKIQPSRAEVIDNCDELKQQRETVANNSDKLESQGAHIADDCDHLEQRDESVINFDSVNTGVEDTFENFTQTMDSLPMSDSLTSTVLPQDFRYLWPDKCKSRRTGILNKAHIVYRRKFNAFYPTLFKNIRTSSHNLSVCGVHSDISILQFQVKPYCEPTAFNIIVQSMFAFRKWKYRRSILFPFRAWKFRQLTFFLFFLFSFSYKTILILAFLFLNMYVTFFSFVSNPFCALLGFFLFLLLISSSVCGHTFSA